MPATHGSARKGPSPSPSGVVPSPDSPRAGRSCPQQSSARRWTCTGFSPSLSFSPSPITASWGHLPDELLGPKALFPGLLWDKSKSRQCIFPMTLTPGMAPCGQAGWHWPVHAYFCPEIISQVKVGHCVSCHVTLQEDSLMSCLDRGRDLPVLWIWRQMEKSLASSEISCFFLCKTPPAQRVSSVSFILSPAQVLCSRVCQGSEGPSAAESTSARQSW